MSFYSYFTFVSAVMFYYLNKLIYLYLQSILLFVVFFNCSIVSIYFKVSY